MTKTIRNIRRGFYFQRRSSDQIPKTNENDPLLLEMVTSDILLARPGSPISRPRSPTAGSRNPETQDIVEEVSSHKDIVDNLNKWSRAIKLAGIGLVSSPIISSLHMVFIVIGMKIANRKAEIEIVRLLGGSGWQVVSSFVYEGVIYGTIGGITAWVLSWLTLLYATWQF